MSFVFARELKTEVLEVDKAFKNSLSPWWDDIYGHIKGLENDHTWNTLPLAVLSIYKFLAVDRQLTIAMTNIFKTLYLANSIHAQIKDDAEGQVYNQDLQFSILIGDYMYGRMLKSLVEVRADHLMGIFADMMSEINEGRVMERKLNAGHMEVVKKTQASLYAAAFETAARLSDMEEESSERYRQLGYNLGMSLELLHINSWHHEAGSYIHEAEKLFDMVYKHKRSQTPLLEKAINELHGIFCNAEKAAVV